MRILIVKSAPWTHEAYCHSKHPEYVAIRNLVAENKQHDIVLIGHGQNFECFRIGKTLFYNLGSGNKLKFLLTLWMNFYLPLLLRPSIVIGMGGINEIPMAIASIVTRAKFVPVIVIDLWYSVSEMPKILEKMIRIFLRSSFKAAYTTLAISESIKRELINDYNVDTEKIIVYKYRISKIFNQHVPHDLKNHLNPDGPVVLTICRINPQKGLEYLITASQSIVQKNPNVKFVIRAYSSDENYRKKLLVLIKKLNLQNNFKIIEEFSPYEEVPKYMAASDVFVLPSISEGFPVVLLEAMACGLPIVATKVGGIPEVLVNNYNGLLVNPCDSEALANSINLILSDENLRKVLSKGAISTTEKIKENEFESVLKRLFL